MAGVEEMKQAMLTELTKGCGPWDAAMRVDPVLKNTTLCDTVGGSEFFYNSSIKPIKV